MPRFKTFPESFRPTMRLLTLAAAILVFGTGVMPAQESTDTEPAKLAHR
jgi:hypothetical protein